MFAAYRSTFERQVMGFHRAKMAERVDSHHCRVLITKNLTECSFLTIRQNRSKALVKARIEHAEP
jgi:hypothetical protein